MFFEHVKSKYSVDFLQLMGVPCEGTPNFWLSADGSYQEEGQNKVMGQIWDKVIHVLMNVSLLDSDVVIIHQ